MGLNFWKNPVEQIVEEKNRLEKKVTELQEEIERLKMKGETDKRVRQQHEETFKKISALLPMGTGTRVIHLWKRKGG